VTVTRWFHGGPAGIRGEILPRSVTGAASWHALRLAGQPAAAAAREAEIADVMGPPDRVYLTTDIRLARYLAARRACVMRQPRGVVYAVRPAGELLADMNMPCAWLCPSAEITGLAALVPATDLPGLAKWFTRWQHNAGVRAWDALTDEDRAAAFAALASRMRARGITIEDVRSLLHAGAAQPDQQLTGRGGPARGKQ